jgi:hypothetical protein
VTGSGDSHPINKIDFIKKGSFFAGQTDFLPGAEGQRERRCALRSHRVSLVPPGKVTTYIAERSCRALDEALLQAPVKVELTRWEAKIARLDDAYDSSRNWEACCSDFSEHTFCGVVDDDVQDLCHTFANHFEPPAMLETHVLENRASNSVR